MTDMPQKQKWFDRELAALLGFFALVWVVIGGGVSYGWPVYACLNSKLGNGSASCEQALELALLPAPVKDSLRRALISTHAYNSDFDKALALLAELEKQNGGSVWLFEEKASLLDRQGKFAEAAVAYAEVLKLQPDNEAAASALIGKYVSLGNLEAARKTAEDAVTYHPNASMISWQGWIEHRAGFHDLALSFYEKAIAVGPESDWLHRDMVDIHLTQGNTEKALLAMEKAIQLAPDLASHRDKRADLYTTQGQFLLAQADYEASLAINRSTETLILLGRSYTDTADYDKALPLFDEALTQNYEMEWAYDSKIRMQVQQKKFDDAQKTIDDLLKFNPESVDARYWSALIVAEQGRFAEALPLLQKLLETAPYYTDAMVEAGHVLIELSRPAEALTYFNSAVLSRPDLAYTFDGRARAHIGVQNWWAALSDANRAIALNVRLGSAHARRGYALNKLGRMIEAQASLETASVTSPQLEWVQRAYMDFLIENGLVTEADVALQRMKDEIPESILVPGYEAALAALRAAKVP
jgi:tetratricopeptide (TPR) repeat protein